MINIAIDQLVPSLLEYMGEDLAQAVLSDIADGARANWIRVAQRELGSSKEDYIQGIQPVAVEDNARVIVLVGWMPNSVENGLDSFDMRETLLGGHSALTRRAKDGHLYGHVPFRHGTPESKGGGGSPMGRAYGPTAEHSLAQGNVMGATAAADLGKKVYEAAKRLSATRTTQHASEASAAMTTTRWGGRLPPGMAPKLAAHHKTDIYAGMVRVRHTYAKTTQTQYRTFRTISQAVPSGWIHPGIRARHLASNVEDWIRDNAAKIVGNAVKRALGVKR